MAATRAVADAVLYEGYLLYPYRHTSPKNRVRWQFGVVVPPAWARAHGLDDDTSVAGSAESSWQQTECLLERGGVVDIHLRFLQVQRREVHELLADGATRPTDAIDRDGVRLVSFDEARSHELTFAVDTADLTAPHVFDVNVPDGEDREDVADPAGAPLAALLRRRWPVRASVEVTAAPGGAPFPVQRLRVRVTNVDTTVPEDLSRDEVLRHSLVATHLILAARSGRFISLLDPPEWAGSAVRECRNVHTFPVLAGTPGTAGIVLSSPIIMYDHPQIAPESPGDLHDATEIDEILTLRALTLSEAERHEIAETDPRAVALLGRVDTMPPEVFERLHGAIRTVRPVPDPPIRTVRVGGVRLGPGSPVRLRPRRRGTDAHDMFLAGRMAHVQEVLLDVDGTTFLAVTVDEDPGAELHQWYGRTRHFRTDEVEPLDEPMLAHESEPR